MDNLKFPYLARTDVLSSPLVRGIFPSARKYYTEEVMYFISKITKAKNVLHVDKTRVKHVRCRLEQRCKAPEPETPNKTFVLFAII